MKYFLFICISVTTLCGSAFANPVSFKDGWGVMPAFGKDWSDLVLNYSLTSRYSIGVSEFYRDGVKGRSRFGMGQFNYLIKRWNELDSQANVYASGGIGSRYDSTEGEGFAGYAALEADYETRRVYTLLSGESIQSANDLDFSRVRYRIGFSPYEAPIESLQTWLIMQVDYMPEMEDKTTVSPVLRLFLNNYALEVGVSFEGASYFAAMAHF